MSGHSGFIPIGPNIQAGNLPSIGGVNNNHANQSANVPEVPPQVPQANEPVNNPPNARSLTQKLDTMLLTAAKMSVRAVDTASLKTVMQAVGMSKADCKALTDAANKA